MVNRCVLQQVLQKVDLKNALHAYFGQTGGEVDGHVEARGQEALEVGCGNGCWASEWG